MNVQQLLRYALVLFGLVAFAAAVAFILQPGLAAGLPFGMGTVLVIGIAIALVGLYQVRGRFKTTLEDAETPNPEYPPPAIVPGDDVDRMLRERMESGRGAIEHREQIEQRLRETAVSVIQYRDDCSEAEAVRQIEEGTWSDDARATGFFDGQVYGEQSFADRFLGDDGDDPFTQTVGIVVDALARRAEMLDESDSTDGEASTGPLERVRDALGTGQDDEEEGIPDVEWNPAWATELDDVPRDAFQELDVHETNHWRGVSAFGLLAVGVGVFALRPAMVLAGAVGIIYAAYSRVNSEPRLEALAVERTVSDDTPEPGDEVRVRVTVRNEGNSTLGDLRIVDVVPDSMVVTDGRPRTGTALRPGKSTTFEYTVVVRRGEFEWPVYVAGRDISGSIEREGFLTPDVSVTCMPSLRTVTQMSVRSQTSQYAGNVDTDTGGAGLEFFSVREYRTGDPMKRVNWNRLARTGELSTIDFREERAATVVLLFDTRRSSYSAPEPGVRHAVDQAVDAATDVFASLHDAGNLVGLAAFDSVPLFHKPGSGSEHLERSRRLFATHFALSSTPPDVTQYVDPMTHVRRQLPSSAQIFLYTPLVDDYGAEVARRLDSMGHLVTVFSPNPTADDTIGQRLARLERMLRINYLRERGIRVVEWSPEERLTLEIERAKQRWTA